MENLLNEIVVAPYAEPKVGVPAQDLFNLKSKIYQLAEKYKKNPLRLSVVPDFNHNWNGTYTPDENNEPIFWHHYELAPDCKAAYLIYELCYNPTVWDEFKKEVAQELEMINQRVAQELDFTPEEAEKFQSECRDHDNHYAYLITSDCLGYDCPLKFFYIPRTGTFFRTYWGE